MPKHDNLGERRGRAQLAHEHHEPQAVDQGKHEWIRARKRLGFSVGGLLASLVTAKPVHVLLALAAVTLFFALQLPKVRIDTSAEGVLLDNDPERHLVDELASTFGLDEIVILAIHCDDVFQAPVLRKVRRLTNELWKLDGVVDVISLTSVRDIVGTEDGFSVTPLMNDVPTRAVALEALRTRALRNPIYLKHLVSADARTTAVNVFLERRPDDRNYRGRIIGQIKKLVSREQGPEEIYLAGIPSTKAAITDLMYRDLLLLTPLTMVVLAIVLYTCFGTLRGVILPLITVGISVTWTLGMLALTGKSISIIMTFMPSLVMMVGTSYVMYILGRYYEFVGLGAPRRDAAWQTIREIGGSVIVSGVTTALGVAALASNDVRTVKELGFYGAFGVVSALLTSLTFVPATLSMLPPRRMHPPRAASLLPTRLLDAVAAFDLHRSRRVLVGTAIALVLVAVGASKLRIETDYVSYFPAGSEIPAADERLHQELSGHVPLYVVVESGEAGGVLEPRVLEKMALLQRFAEGISGVDATLSLVDYVERMHGEMNKGRAAGRLPNSRRLVAQYVLLYTMSSPTHDLWHYLSGDKTRASIIVRTDLVNSVELGKAITQIRDYAEGLFSSDPVRVTVTGTMVLLNKTADAISRGQLRSLTIAFLGITGVLLVVLWAPGIVGAALIPNILPVAAVFGAMGFLGIHLTTGTAIVGSLVLGIAVDDTVHYVMRYRRELATGKDRSAAIASAISGVGRPMMFTSLALCCGFSVFLLSEFSPLRALGGLTALTMVVAVLADLILLPVLLLVIGRRSSQDVASSSSMGHPKARDLVA